MVSNNWPWNIIPENRDQPQGPNSANYYIYLIAQIANRSQFSLAFCMYRSRLRPRTPEYNEGERRYSADEHRRHFERMTRDEPTERPADWSDSRVRYQYYKDRGYFRDRPCPFDEFVKWEEWWYKYRDWLANEGYYNQDHHQDTTGYGQPPPQHSTHSSSAIESSRHHREMDEWHHQQAQHLPPPQGHHYTHQQSIPPPQRHHGRVGPDGPSHSPVSGFVPLSSRANFGRPDGSAYLQAGQHQDIRRRIGRTTNGSLVVRVGGGVSGGANGFRTSGGAVGRLGRPPNVHRR